MTYSQKIKDYAKELYLTVGSDNNHEYTLEAIIEIIEEVIKEKAEKIALKLVNEKLEEIKKSFSVIIKICLKRIFCLKIILKIN